MKITKPKKLRTGDMIVYGGPRLSPLAMIIRSRTAGRKYMFKAGVVGVHVDIVCDMYGQRLTVGMGPQGIEIVTPMEPPRKRVPLLVRRHPVYDSKAVRTALARRLMYDMRLSLEYDFKGVMSFVMESVKENRKRFYCSEHFVYQTRQDKVRYPRNYYDRVSPWQLQTDTDSGWYDLDLKDG